MLKNESGFCKKQPSPPCIHQRNQKLGDQRKGRQKWAWILPKNAHFTRKQSKYETRIANKNKTHFKTWTNQPLLSNPDSDNKITFNIENTHRTNHKMRQIKIWKERNLFSILNIHIQSIYHQKKKNLTSRLNLNQSHPIKHEQQWNKQTSFWISKN